MIFDHLSHSKIYENAAINLDRAFAFLRNTNLAEISIGRHAIDGDDVFALVQEYQTKLSADAKWEAHRKYVDVQYIAAGCERIGCGNLDDFQIIKNYSEADDYMLLSGEGSEIILNAGAFAVFFPHDAHRPTMAVGQPAAVRKVVVKVRV